MYTSFFDIPREKLIEIIPEVIRNSEEKYNSACEMAKTGKLSTASSLLLISVEEVVKALVIVLDARGFEFRTTRGIDIFFKNHEIRFFVGWMTIASSMFGDDFFKLVKEIKEDPQKLLQHKDDIINKVPHIERHLKWYMLRKLILIMREMEWFSQAEVFRQNGFYIDMNGNLNTSIKISDKQFEEAKEKIERVNRTLRQMIDLFLSKDPIVVEAVEHMKGQFEENKFYELISNKLLEIRKRRKSIFEEIKTSFFEPFYSREGRKQLKVFSQKLSVKT